MIERLSLNSLKFFYYVARYESVTIAAEKLFVTQGAVSKQLKNLDETLGYALFSREGRSLILTDQGRILFECCQQVFQQIDQCLIQLQSEKKSQNTLIVSCEPTIAMKWLIPRLGKFKQLYPNLEVSLLTSGGAVDFETQNIDLALRRNDFDWGKAVYSEKIADEYMLCVGKKNIQLIEQIFISSSRPKLWQKFLEVQNGRFNESNKSVLEHFYLCIEASIAGLGASVVSAYMVEREIKYQMLDKLSPVYKDDSAYFLLSASPFGDDVRKVVFKTWLIEEMQASQAEFSALNI